MLARQAPLGYVKPRGQLGPVTPSAGAPARGGAAVPGAQGPRLRLRPAEGLPFGELSRTASGWLGDGAPAGPPRGCRPAPAPPRVRTPPEARLCGARGGARGTPVRSPCPRLWLTPSPAPVPSGPLGRAARGQRPGRVATAARGHFRELVPAGHPRVTAGAPRSRGPSPPGECASRRKVHEFAWREQFLSSREDGLDSSLTQRDQGSLAGRAGSGRPLLEMTRIQTWFLPSGRRGQM